MLRRKTKKVETVVVNTAPRDGVEFLAHKLGLDNKWGATAVLVGFVVIALAVGVPVETVTEVTTNG